MSALTNDILLIVLLVMLTVVMPPMGIRDMRVLRRRLAAGQSDARLKMYRSILAWEWGLVAVFVTWWLVSGRPLGSAYMGFAPEGWDWLAIGLGVAFIVAQVIEGTRVLANKDKHAELREKADNLADLVPRNDSERRLFDSLSFTAGICEEILYRGLLLGALAPVMGVWPAVAVSSVIFGLGHMYQGAGGIVKTGLVGVFMALLTVFSGSIWIAVLVHAVIDATSGKMLSAALASGDDGAAQPEPAV